MYTVPTSTDSKSTSRSDKKYRFGVPFKVRTYLLNAFGIVYYFHLSVVVSVVVISIYIIVIHYDCDDQRKLK